MTPDEQAMGSADDARLAESIRALSDLGAGPAPMPSDRLAAFFAAPTSATAPGLSWLLKAKLARMTSAGKVLVIGATITLAGAASATATWQATTPPSAPVVVPLGPVSTDTDPEPADNGDADNPAVTDDEADAPSSEESDSSENGDGNSGKSDDSDEDSDDGDDNSGKSYDSDEDSEDGDDNSGKSDDSDDGEGSGSGGDGSDDQDEDDQDSGADEDPGEDEDEQEDEDSDD